MNEPYGHPLWDKGIWLEFTHPFWYKCYICLSPWSCYRDMYAYWHYISIIAHLLTLWYLSNDWFHLPTRENYCTFSPFCAGISSINGASSYLWTSREGDFWVFGVQILTPEIIFLGSREHSFRVRKRPIPILMNVWLPGCKRLHPGLQTFASWVANACVWDDKPK